MERRLTVACACAALCIALEFQGCTAIGLVIGSGIDKGNASVDTVSVLNPYELKRGTQTVILTKDSTVCAGVFLGIENTPPEVYREQYDDWHANGKVHGCMPALGDSITLVLNSSENSFLSGEFAGFTRTSVLVRHDAGPRYNGVVTTVNLTKIDSVYDNLGKGTSGRMLMSAMASGDIPTPTRLVLADGADTNRIPSHMVLRIKCLATVKPVAGRITGAVVGFVVDAVVVAALAESLYRHPLFSPMTW